MATILAHHGVAPRIHPTAFVAPTAVLIGNVEVGEEASIWFGAVLRGDDPTHGIRIGARSSVQDNCVLHVSARGPTVVGEEVTVGHGAVFESCEVRRGALIGMNAVILQGAVIGEEALVAALSVVPEGMQVPPRTLVAGAPARIRKQLAGGSARWIRESARHYVELSRTYLAQGIGGAIQGSGIRGQGSGDTASKARRPVDRPR
ncbi:MAG: gamma carbonic anhydrase family protein [Gemmatimonadetes bacterium]|nr:gamma carbonic anhydrase family protein [Gemmatimonadota bacterium]